MRKLLFLIILIPFFAALGHDTYMFYLNQDKGFRLSDVGALWDKYHKESHDQWKIKLHEYGQIVDEKIEQIAPLTPLQSTDTEKTEEDNTPKAPYAQSFQQEDSKDNAKPVQKTIKEEKLVEGNISTIQNIFGWLLEQKAVFVFGGFALVIYLINAFFGMFTKEKDSMDKITAYKKGKKGGYKYSRK